MKSVKILGILGLLVMCSPSFARDAPVTHDRAGGTRTRNVDYTGPETGTVTRGTNYSTFDGRQGSKSDVIQRTEDGFARDTTRTTRHGETHTRSVDVSCDKDARKCVKQVEVGQQP